MSSDLVLEAGPEAIPIVRTAPRVSSLDGRTVTLLDISKRQGDHFLDRIEELLGATARPLGVVRERKPTFGRPAPEELRRKILSRSEVVIEALAD